METDSVKRINESGPRERRFANRYPFAAEAEILDLKSGTRLSGVTSDLSLGGCLSARAGRWRLERASTSH